MSRKLAWRKLLSDPPSAWQRLPLITRGVGDEILRAVDSDGEIDCGTEQPAVVVCRLTAAHPRERRRVAEAVEELIAEGFLRIEARDGSTILAVQLPDLSLAAKAPKSVRSGPGPNHERARTEPEARANPTRSEPEPDVNRARTEPEVGPNSAESFGSGSGEEKREEERREEKRREEINSPTRRGGLSRPCSRARAREAPTRPDPRPPDDRPPLERARSTLSVGYARHYERECGDLWQGMGANGQAIRDVAAWCAASNPDEPEAAAELVLAGMFADSWMRERRWPWGPVAKDPAKYAALGRETLERERRAARAQREAERRAAEEREREAQTEREAVPPPEEARALIRSLTSILSMPREDASQRTEERRRELEAQARQLREARKLREVAK